MVEIAAIGFLIMGLVGLFSPQRMTALVDIAELSAAGRNEVRAVYGGFGVVIGGLLLATVSEPELHEGVVLTVAVALLGMVAGRCLSWVIERRIDVFPLLFMVGELLFAAGLLLAL